MAAEPTKKKKRNLGGSDSDPDIADETKVAGAAKLRPKRRRNVLANAVAAAASLAIANDIGYTVDQPSSSASAPLALAIAQPSSSASAASAPITAVAPDAEVHVPLQDAPAQAQAQAAQATKDVVVGSSFELTAKAGLSSKLELEASWRGSRAEVDASVCVCVVAYRLFCPVFGPNWTSQGKAAGPA